MVVFVCLSSVIRLLEGRVQRKVNQPDLFTWRGIVFWAERTDFLFISFCGPREMFAVLFEPFLGI
jgi:hypothetical protein